MFGFHRTTHILQDFHVYITYKLAQHLTSSTPLVYFLLVVYMFAGVCGGYQSDVGPLPQTPSNHVTPSPISPSKKYCIAYT